MIARSSPHLSSRTAVGHRYSTPTGSVAGSTWGRAGDILQEILWMARRYPEDAGAPDTTDSRSGNPGTDRWTKFSTMTRRDFLVSTIHSTYYHHSLN